MTYKVSILVGLFLLLPLVSHAEQIPDYYNPYAPISTDKQVYSWTDKVHITIDAPSWNENRFGVDSIGDDPSYAVKISTSSHKLEPYKLVETGPNTGTFVGEVTLTGFSHDADGDGQVDTNPRTGGNGPTSGFLETDRNDGLSISFEFADGVVLTQNAQIRWNHGQISFDKKYYLLSETALVRVIEPDMNLNPEASDTMPIEISSDSDTAGITVYAVETDESSGVFEADISFTQTGSSSGNRLFALPDDVIYAKYEDNTLPSPYSTSDSLDVTAESILEVDPQSQKVDFTNLAIVDNSGIIVEEPKTEQQLQISAEIKNAQSYEQPFAYLVQVKNSKGIVISLSWFEGSLVTGQQLEVSQSWVPTEPDTYSVETFVWKSITNPFPLAKPITSAYKVT